MILRSVHGPDDCLYLGQKGQKKHSDDKREKIFVVVFADACAHPRAVMVESLNADIAVIAVGGSRGPIHKTLVAELETE